MTVLTVVARSIIAFYAIGFVLFALGTFVYSLRQKNFDWFVAIMSVLAVGLIWPKVLYSAIKVRRNKKRV